MDIDRRQWLTFTAISTALMLLGSKSPAGNAPDDKFLRRMSRSRASLRSLTADFTQKRHLDLFSTDVTSHGKLALVAPGRLRWQLLPPDDITYWVTPGGLSYKSSKGRGHVDRAQAGALAGSLDDMMALLGGDLTKLRKRYELRAVTRQDRSAQVTATPRDAKVKKLVQRIEVTLESDLVRPRKVTLWENKDDYSEIRFRNAKKNVPVADALMRP